MADQIHTLLLDDKAFDDKLAQMQVLLIGPYDPKCGEYTFIAPPLGIWRLYGQLTKQGIHTRVFDPNCCESEVTDALKAELKANRPTIVGVSTTGMTLNYDLELGHLVKKLVPEALLLAGGMEATFKPEQMLDIGPFEIVVMGEGEKPLQEIVRRVATNRALEGIPGTCHLNNNNDLIKLPGPALTQGELAETIENIPYQHMPYKAYWDHLEAAYAVGCLPSKADREARLSEIRSVRLITLNYCPMGCSFCSSTNFLHEAQGKVTKVARLDANQCISSIDTILKHHPDTRTIIFQDDIFVFTKDDRIIPLCNLIQERKQSGQWPRDLGFISTNRIDAMSPERLDAMFAAGFRVLGFGIESFAPNILKEFNKHLIYKHIQKNLKAALDAGVTPFLDLIMSSPKCSLEDIKTNVLHAHYWLEQGCEIGMYPFVIPFSGSAMATDPTLSEQTEWETKSVCGTDISWEQPTRILPRDKQAREAMLEIEKTALADLADIERHQRHVPSRVRSLVWIRSALRQLHLRNLIEFDDQSICERIRHYLPASDLPVFSQPSIDLPASDEKLDAMG